MLDVGLGWIDRIICRRIDPCFLDCCPCFVRALVGKNDGRCGMVGSSALESSRPERGGVFRYVLWMEIDGLMWC